MQYAVLAILIIAVIGFLVVLWKAAPYWPWYSLTCAALTMIMAAYFLYPTAGVLSSRAAWHKVKEDQEVRLQAALAERERLNYGDPGNPAAGRGVAVLTQELSKLGGEAGRRWRNLVVRGGDQGTITLVRPAPPADQGAVAEDAPAAAEGGLVPEGLITYAFAEQPREGSPARVPTFYLGEFRVTQSDANTVTVEPTSPLAPQQQQAITSGQANSWSLYELLPLDGHSPFIADGSQPDEENLFGRPNEELIKSLLGNSISEETLTSYVRDGSRATPDDPVPTRWVRVEFNQEYTEVVDNPSQTGVLDGGYFDGSGRAVDSRLQRGDEGVKFEKGDQLVIKQEAAKPLLDENVVTVVDTYFVRPLNDYRFVISNIRLRQQEMEVRKLELEFEQTQLRQAKESSEKLLGERQLEIVRLEEDLRQTETEKVAIESYAEELKRRSQELRQTVVRLFRANQQLEDEIQRFYQMAR